MPVKKDKDGRRSVQAKVEVPGSPEEVWQAIASGEGISSWFMPSTVEQRTGGKAVTSFGPGMDSSGTITTWNPPHSYLVETAEGPGNVATEWIVEARDGGTCTVRVVHRWFADTDDWDGEFEGHAYGWAASFFRTLRVYLEHFVGQPCSAFHLTAFSQDSAPDTWRTISNAFDVDDATGRVAPKPGTPGLAGTVEAFEITDPELRRVRETSPQVAAALEGMDGVEPDLLVRLHRPAPGFAHWFVMPMGETTMVSARFHLFGEPGAQTAAQTQQAWSDWLAKRFPGQVPQ